MRVAAASPGNIHPLARWDIPIGRWKHTYEMEAKVLTSETTCVSQCNDEATLLNTKYVGGAWTGPGWSAWFLLWDTARFVCRIVIPDQWLLLQVRTGLSGSLNSALSSKCGTGPEVNCWGCELTSRWSRIRFISTHWLLRLTKCSLISETV